MKNDRMLNEKIKDYQSKISQLNAKKILSLVGALGFGAFTVGVGSLLYSSFMELFLPITAFNTFLPAACLYSYKLKDNQKNALQKRVNHLKKIKNEGISKSDFLDQKRTNQINRLEEKQKELEKSIDRAALGGALSGFAWLAGCGVSFFYPAAIWGTLAGMIGFGAGCIAEEEASKKSQEYQTRIDNLKDDLIFGPVYKKKPVKEIRSTQTKDVSSLGDKKTSSKYKKEVDDYIHHLTEEDSKENPYQKVKR